MEMRANETGSAQDGAAQNSKAVRACSPERVTRPSARCAPAMHAVAAHGGAAVARFAGGEEEENDDVGVSNTG